MLTLTLTANGTYDKAFFLIEREAYITIPSVIIGVRLGFNGLLYGIIMIRLRVIYLESWSLQFGLRGVLRAWVFVHQHSMLSSHFASFLNVLFRVEDQETEIRLLLEEA